MCNQLEVIVKESGLESTKAQFILNQFKGYFDIAADWEIKAKSIVVTDASQDGNMKLARAGRLFLREKRIAIEKARKELKEQSLREGKAIDGIANVLKALIVPIEEHLERQEKFVELKEKAEQEAKQKEIEHRVEEELLAKEKAEREEQERIRLENERLKKEAEERERIHREEQAKAAAEHKKLEAKRAAEKKKADDRLRKERERAEGKAAAEYKKREREAAIAKKAADQRLRKQQKEAEAARLKQETVARKERVRLEAEKKAAEEVKRAAMSNYEKLLAFVREVANYDFTCGHCESSGSDLDSKAVGLLKEIGESNE